MAVRRIELPVSTPGGADDSLGHCLAQPEWVTNRDHKVANL